MAKLDWESANKPTYYQKICSYCGHRPAKKGKYCYACNKKIKKKKTHRSKS